MRRLSYACAAGILLSLLVAQPAQAGTPAAVAGTPAHDLETTAETPREEGVPEAQEFDQALFDAFTDEGDAAVAEEPAGSARGASLAAENSPLRQQISAEALDAEVIDADEAATSAVSDCDSSYNYNFHDYECQAFVG